MVRNYLAERRQSRYFDSHRPDNTSPVSEAEAKAVLDRMDGDERAEAIGWITDHDNHNIAGIFHCSDAMESALIGYVQGGGR